MVPEEGYVMHHRLCWAMVRWSNINGPALGSQHDRPSDESMHAYARSMGLAMPMATDVTTESPGSGGQPVAPDAVQKGAVA